MRYFLLIGLLPFLSQCRTQVNELNNTWIGEHLEYIKISGDTAWFDQFGRAQKFELQQKDGEIILTNNYIDSKKVYRYQIKYISTDSLILIPLDPYSSSVFQDRENVFVRKEIAFEKEIQFSSLYFSASVCFGECPSFKIKIDSAGSVNFYAGSDTGLAYGDYTGKLNQKQLDSLHLILKNCGIDKLPARMQHAYDAPQYKIQIELGDQIITSQGNLTPYLLEDFINFMYRLYKNIELVPSALKFDFPVISD